MQENPPGETGRVVGEVGGMKHRWVEDEEAKIVCRVELNKFPPLASLSIVAG